MPRDVQKRVGRALHEMEADPFQGDVKTLKGRAWKLVFRRRIGSYRILFTADHKKKTISVVRILLRSEKTYR
ncbi:MAG: type II toxin-antitoxin system RelE/ParE family toxin [Acidobacteria bacterium]|nr:type II toxin-antitoxin system RelE/ParE family toxin [Acidobacteriota bacterium]MBI3473311.1 type II toxin-antitoxin system RelE/ParE family toxin [Candidatus Solibacter usitatus]